jgi:hypothetical protein
MDKEEIYRELKGRVTNVRFEELCRAAELFGFEFKGGKGSHRIFVKEGVKELLNFQDVRGRQNLIKLDSS